MGRVAQLGFAAALIGEAVTGVGPLAQLGLETGIPLKDAEPVLLASIILTLFTAINEVRAHQELKVPRGSPKECVDPELARAEQTCTVTAHQGLLCAGDANQHCGTAIVPPRGPFLR